MALTRRLNSRGEAALISGSSLSDTAGPIPLPKEAPAASCPEDGACPSILGYFVLQ